MPGPSSVERRSAHTHAAKKKGKKKKKSIAEIELSESSSLIPSNFLISLVRFSDISVQLIPDPF
jgi:hypothetical protein